MKNLRVSQKLALAFGMICLLCVLEGIVAFWAISRTNRLTLDLTTRTIPASQSIGDLRNQVQSMRRMELALLICPDDKCKQSYIKRRDDAIKQYEVRKSELKKLLTTDEFEDVIAVDRATYNYLDKSTPIFETAIHAAPQEMDTVRTQERGLLADFNAAMDKANNASLKL